MTIDIAIIGATAATAAKNADELAAAISVERDGEHAVLAAAIAAARPAWRAISSRLISYQMDSGGRDGLHPVSEKCYHEQRGCILRNGYERNTNGDGNSGTFDGACLVLLETGQLAALTRSGTWSLWQGATNEWRSTLVMYDDAREAMDEWDLEPAIDGLMAALKRQADGKAPERAKAARERAEKLNAIATLVK